MADKTQVAINEITYSTGLHSRRTGSRLLWWRDPAHAVEGIFAHSDKITDPTPYDVTQITRAGYNPADFCRAGDKCAARILIPEILACIAYAQAIIDKKAAEDVARFEAAVASGEAFRVIEDAPAYGCDLVWARWSKPGEGYHEYVMFSFSGSPRVEVNREARKQVIGDRKSDGCFPGCSNQTWIITEGEWYKIIEVSVLMEASKTDAIAQNEADKAADTQHKIDTGYCFACESYCHGDCGHYSNDPHVMHVRNLKTAISEQNYGISEEA